MKLIYLLLFLSFYNEVLSQEAITIEGQVRDHSTKEPLAYAAIQLVGTNFGTVTNQSGNFIFKYSPSGKDDILVFSHLGYKPFQVYLLDTVKRYFTISLEPQPFQLDEIVVKPLDPLDIVYSCIRNFSKNYNGNSHAVHGFQREYVKQSDKYIQLIEVAFRTQSLGQDDAKISNVLNARYIEDKKEKAPLWNPSRGGFYTFGWTTISGIENPSAGNFLGVNIKTKSDLARYYEFLVVDPITYGDKELYVVEFDQKKNLKRPLLKGKLFIDPDSHAIVKLIYEISPRGIKSLKSHETFGDKRISRPPKKIDIKNERYEVTYRMHGNKWYLNTLVVDTEFDASLVFFGVVQSQKNSLKLHSERVVTAIDTAAVSSSYDSSNIADIGSIPTLQNFIKKHFENYHELSQEKWADVNFIQSDTSIAHIAEELSRNNEQWEFSRQQQLMEKAIAASKLTIKQLNEDVDYLKETLEKIHPGLHWYTDKNELDREFESIRKKLKKKNTDEEFFQLLSPSIAKIHCGHTNIKPSFVRSEYQKLYSKVFPLDLWITGDSCFVRTSRKNILKGSEVLSINGYDVPQIIGKIKKAISSDGFNLTYKEFLLNHKFSSLFSMYFPVKDTFEVKIKDVDGTIKDMKFTGETKNDEQNQRSSLAKLSISDSSKTAILSIPSFSTTNHDFPAFLENSFEQVDKTGIENLIIDLRNNEGGRDEYGLLLFSYLFNEPFKYYKNLVVATADTTLLNRLNFGDVPFNSAIPDYISNINEENGSYFYTTHANLGLHQPKEHSFKGHLYVLINGGTFSTAAEFAAIAQNSKRGIFIGEETGGGYYGNCSLGTPTLTLPNSKIRITIPLAKYELAVDRTIPEGHGVIPDYKTKYSLKDILENTDKDLELCLKIIGESAKR